MPGRALTSRELADNAHGDVGAGAGPPLPAAALDPVAAVVAQHAGAQARGPPVGVVHNGVVLPDQGASCGGEGTEGFRGRQTRQSRSRWERASLFEYPFSLPQVLTPHALVKGTSPTARAFPSPPPTRGTHLWG